MVSVVTPTAMTTLRKRCSEATIETYSGRMKEHANARQRRARRRWRCLRREDEVPDRRGRKTNAAGDEADRRDRRERAPVFDVGARGRRAARALASVLHGGRLAEGHRTRDRADGDA